MDKLTKEQLEKTMEAIKAFKQMIAEKGSKEAVVAHLMNETGLAMDECESAYDFYSNIQLPESIEDIV